MENDRGTIKWTSLMLPEHVELLKAMWEEDRITKKPLLDPQEIELLNVKLQNAYNKRSVINLTFYTNKEIVNQIGVISRMDKNRQSLLLKKPDNQKITVPFSDILAISPV
ncbi:YolD-like family protein [Virgibacillus kekensis]|uniref:YolD-like family protein n=1 Tax=Virgibacillus kekensis TaxID=202261 RepID=A0ABV9DHP9_9BACI